MSNESFDDTKKLNMALARIQELESNALEQAKLLADTGRRVEEQDDLLAEAADYLNSHSGMDGMDIGARITAYRFAQQKGARAALSSGEAVK